MPKETILADFSGGMNASVAVDKLADKECLLAENCRFDEQGNLLITGANSIQGTYGTDGIHSIFTDPGFGAIAGGGKHVYIGENKDLTTLSTSTIANPSSSKMSFGLANGRVYMDLSKTGYFLDSSVSDLTTVDWAPPSASSAVTTGPNTAATFASNTAQGFGFALDTASTMQGMVFTVVGTMELGNNGYLQGGITLVDNVTGTATYTAALMVAGVVVGTSTFVNDSDSNDNLGTNTTINTFTFGNGNSLWGDPSLTSAQVNAGNFGVVFHASGRTQGRGGVIAVTIGPPSTATAYQSASGFVAGTGAAGTLTGTYTWKVTFTALNGEESDASVASTAVVLSAKQGTLTAIPTGDARTRGRNIYRKGGFLSSYYLVGSIPDNIATTFSDNQSDLAALQEGIILPGDVVGDEPNTRLGNQVVQFPTLHYDRIFWASGNMLIWSKPLNGFAYPADFGTPVGDGKGITGIFSISGELFILKPDSIWLFSGTDETSFVLSKTLSSVGCDEPFTAVLAGGSSAGYFITGRIVFANRRGLWSFNGYTSNKLTPKLDLWFRQDDKTGKAIRGTNGFHPPEITNQTVTGNFSGASNSTFYYLSYAEAGKTANNAALVFDLERGQITKRPLAALSLAVDTVSGYVYAGLPNGVIVKVDDWTALTSGTGSVNMDFQTKYNDMEARGSKLAVWGLEFLINTNGQTVTPSVVFDDGNSSESLAAISTTQPDRVYRSLASANSRFCRNFSILLNAQSSVVNAAGVPSIQLTHIKVYWEPRLSRARTGEN